MKEDNSSCLNNNLPTKTRDWCLEALGVSSNQMEAWFWDIAASNHTLTRTLVEEIFEEAPTPEKAKRIADILLEAFMKTPVEEVWCVTGDCHDCGRPWFNEGEFVTTVSDLLKASASTED